MVTSDASLSPTFDTAYPKRRCIRAAHDRLHIADLTKNSRVERLKKQKYEVSKKVLQLEIKTISKQLGHIPTKEEVTQHSKFPIEYFENYFVSWGEVTAAARTTGMTENRQNGNGTYKTPGLQLRLFEEKESKYKKTKKSELVTK